MSGLSWCQQLSLVRIGDARRFLVVVSSRFFIILFYFILETNRSGRGARAVGSGGRAASGRSSIRRPFHEGCDDVSRHVTATLCEVTMVWPFPLKEPPWVTRSIDGEMYAILYCVHKGYYRILNSWH